MAGDLQDSSERNYTKAECLIYINQAHWLMKTALANNGLDLGYKDITPIAISEDDTSVSLPADFLAPKLLFLSGKTYPLDLRRYNYDQLILKYQGSTAKGEPRYGAVKDFTLHFRPTANDSYSLIGPYYDLPAEWSDEKGDTPWNGIFNNVYRQFVTYRCKNRDEYTLEVDEKWLGIFRNEALKVLGRRRAVRKMSPFRGGEAETIYFDHQYE